MHRRAAVAALGDGRGAGPDGVLGEAGGGAEPESGDALVVVVPRGADDDVREAVAVDVAAQVHGRAELGALGVARDLQGIDPPRPRRRHLVQEELTVRSVVAVRPGPDEGPPVPRPAQPDHADADVLVGDGAVHRVLGRQARQFAGPAEEHVEGAWVLGGRAPVGVVVGGPDQEVRVAVEVEVAGGRDGGAEGHEAQGDAGRAPGPHGARGQPRAGAQVQVRGAGLVGVADHGVDVAVAVDVPHAGRRGPDLPAAGVGQPVHGGVGRITPPVAVGTPGVGRPGLAGGANQEVVVAVSVDIAEGGDRAAEALRPGRRGQGERGPRRRLAAAPAEARGAAQVEVGDAGIADGVVGSPHHDVVEAIAVDVADARRPLPEAIPVGGPREEPGGRVQVEGRADPGENLAATLVGRIAVPGRAHQEIGQGVAVDVPGRGHHLTVVVQGAVPVLRPGRALRPVGVPQEHPGGAVVADQVAPDGEVLVAVAVDVSEGRDAVGVEAGAGQGDRVLGWHHQERGHQQRIPTRHRFPPRGHRSSSAPPAWRSPDRLSTARPRGSPDPRAPLTGA